jgi:hypothetical protein
LKVHQGRTSAEEVDVNALRSDILKDLYAQNQTVLLAKEERIEQLEAELNAIRLSVLPTDDILKELRAQHPDIEEFTMNRNAVYRMDQTGPDTILIALARFKGKLKQEELVRMRNWLKVRTHMDSVTVVIQ